tara:strand:+ start:760 stop:945 length:186 start_codon:yes stop_codon:yes gene_type:complete
MIREREMLHAGPREKRRKGKEKKGKKKNEIQSAYRTTRIPRGSQIVSLLRLFWVVKKSSNL